MNRKIRIVLFCCAAAAVGLAAGLPAWRNRQLERRVARTVETLELRDPPPIEPDLVAALEGKAGYAAELRLFRGVQRLRSGEPALALELFSNVKPEGRLRVPLLLCAGNALYRTGRLADAVRLFREVEFEKPRVVSAHRWLATVYHDLGALQSTLVQLEKVAELEPEDFFAYRLMGLLYLEDFLRPQEAIDNYQRALQKSPPPGQAQSIRTELARALLQLNDYSKALEVLEAADQNALVVGLKADCRWNMGDTDAARRLLEEARKLDPQERAVLYLSGRFALEDGRPEEALAPFRTLLERDPHDYQIRYQLSQAYRQLGNQDAAAAELDRVNESKTLTEKLGPMFEQAVLHPNDAEIRDELARLCEKMGKRELADVWRRAAAQLRSGAAAGPVR